LSELFSEAFSDAFSAPEDLSLAPELRSAAPDALSDFAPLAESEPERVLLSVFRPLAASPALEWRGDDASDPDFPGVLPLWPGVLPLCPGAALPEAGVLPVCPGVEPLCPGVDPVCPAAEPLRPGFVASVASVSALRVPFLVVLSAVASLDFDVLSVVVLSAFAPGDPLVLVLVLSVDVAGSVVPVEFALRPLRMRAFFSAVVLSVEDVPVRSVVVAFGALVLVEVRLARAGSVLDPVTLVPEFVRSVPTVVDVRSAPVVVVVRSIDEPPTVVLEFTRPMSAAFNPKWV